MIFSPKIQKSFKNYFSRKMKKRAIGLITGFLIAETVGFEPTWDDSRTDFESASL